MDTVWTVADQSHYRFIGVPDMAAVRFSLPAQLIEPIPNLGGAVWLCPSEHN
jgi:hypothetical protein